MKYTKKYVDYVTNELLKDVAGVRARAMFGGYGLYKDDTIFACVINDKVYYKVGESNMTEYVKAKSKPFTYKSNGKEYAMSYWLVPKKVLSSPKLLKEWTKKAVAVAVEARKVKRKRA